MLIFRFCRHSENKRPKLWGIGSLKFFRMMCIYEMAVIFWFFHNGRCQYSVSVNTWKTRNPNFGAGSVIWYFSIWCIFMKWWPFFKFFRWPTPISCFCQHWKKQRPKLWGSVIWNFSVWCIFMKWWPFFDFFIMAHTDILFLSTLGKPETQTLEDQ